MKKIPTFLLGFIIGGALFSGVAVGAATYLKATPSNVKVVVDGKEAKLSDKPLNVNGKTYLPIRDTANALNYGVSSVTSSKIELKSGTTVETTRPTPTNPTTDSKTDKTNTNNTGSSTSNTKVKNLKETYSTDGKLDATKIREALNNGKLDVNAQDEETGNTLLHYVILENNFSAYTAIKRNALNPNIQNKQGNAPLHTAILEKNVFYFGELTGDLKADANIANKEGKKPIDLTSKNSAERIGLEAYMM